MGCSLRSILWFSFSCLWGYLFEARLGHLTEANFYVVFCMSAAVFISACMLFSIVCAAVDTKLVYCRKLGTVYNIFWGNLTYRALGQLVAWSTVFLFLFQFYIRSTFVNYLEIGGLISADSTVFLHELVTSTTPLAIDGASLLSPVSLPDLGNSEYMPDYVRALWGEKNTNLRTGAVLKIPALVDGGGFGL